MTEQQQRREQVTKRASSCLWMGRSPARCTGTNPLRGRAGLSNGLQTGLAHKPNQSTYSCVSSREYPTRDDKTYAPRCILRSPPKIRVSYKTDMCTYGYILTLTFEFCSYNFIRCMQQLESIAYLVHSAGITEYFYPSKLTAQASCRLNLQALSVIG